MFETWIWKALPIGNYVYLKDEKDVDAEKSEATVDVTIFENASGAREPCLSGKA